MAKERGIQTRILNRLKSSFPKSKWINIHVDTYGNTGEPDILGTVRGLMFAIEVKNEDGELSDMQKVKLKMWYQAGAKVMVVRSAQQAERLVSLRMGNWTPDAD